MKQIFKLVAAILVALTATLSLTSCSAEKVDMASVAAVIDVRPLQHARQRSTSDGQPSLFASGL